VRLRLTSGSGQDDYQADLLRFLTKASPYNPGPTPPVGPTASTITMSYEASADLPLNTTDAAIYEARPARFFHVAPFGTAEQHPHINGSTAQTLLPQFVSSRDGATVRSEAEFYIGVSGLVPPQELSLLFQVVDGTADPLAPKPEAHIGWSYLSGNRWIEFDKTAVRDRSGELLKSGIVTLAMPREATADNTLLPAGLYWIRAAVAEWGEAVCKLRLVAAQAVEAVFADRQNAPGFSATPIPAGTVSKLERPDAAVKTISQPFASFGGRGAEQAEDFYTRVSERLRHKDRAIDLWDYEHLILEAFPQVYRARCLNHTRYEPSETGAGAGIYRELAAGHVTIVTLPDLKTQQQRDPLKPYTSLSVLQDIEAFLKQRMNCFARLHVRNPKFEAVRVRFKVRLNEHFDEAYYTGQLKQAIVRFLSPWAFAEGDLPNFGGKIYKSVLINFIEDQPGVDYVTDFQLFHDVDDGQGTVDLDEIEGTKAVSILVSAPADDHDISVINPAAAAQLGEDCGCDA
jgi:hypothetical protein